MGGNLFKLGRLPRTEYLAIEGSVRQFLDQTVGAESYRIPRYYGAKSDFGDLDVILARSAIDGLGGISEFGRVLAEGLGVTRTKSVGHVYSTVYREFQVDYFIRAPELLQATYCYLSFNDLGNLIGKIYRRLGLKYGEDGLSYVFRRTSQPNYQREVPVSRDWHRILAFAGLDVDAWEAGFHYLDDMFAWVVASPYFSVAPYDRGSRKQALTTRRRARVRPTMAKFIEWLKAEGVVRRCEYLAERDAYVPQIAAAFPEAQLEQRLAEERRREGEDLALRQKFSGQLVREWTGLEGKVLGELVRRFGTAYSREDLMAMAPEAIRTAVLSFAQGDEGT